ncbi:MAG TPA: pyruvate ferredoxin oxidoreductase [Candidatus Woesearchaeota archaeon]|nr:pyruvate ferredoxin oxidoreductase [Candidatus Woesearchaeota archaeon]
MKKVIEASTAVALGVKLYNPAVIPMYPITPQTHIVERLADYINDGLLKSEMIHAESEHSAISAALGAEAMGIRVFTATASQGLALMHEILFVVAGMRLPVVIAVANRALSAPINIWNDHQDSISERDSGWIQLYVESAQEALDTIIQAYKIAENRKVLLPVMVCLDGFTLSHVYEPVDIPEKKDVDKFLPKYNPLFRLDPEKPVTMGPIGFPNTYMEFRKATHEAMLNSIEIIKDVNNDFKNSFNRSYGNGLIETYKINDAEYAVATMGTACGTTRVVVDELRKQGEKVGLIKIKSFRPFPKEEVINCCKNIKGIAVLDRNISLGNEGALCTELRSAFYNQEKKPIIKGFIAGLGGRDITPEHIKTAFKKIETSNNSEWLL